MIYASSGYGQSFKPGYPKCGLRVGRLASPRNLLQMQILRPDFRTIVSESQGLGPGSCFKKTLQVNLKFGKHWFNYVNG